MEIKEIDSKFGEQGGVDVAVIDNWFVDGIALGNLIDSEKNEVEVFRESCIGLITPAEVYILNVVLENFTKEYISNMLEIMASQRKKLKEEDLYFGEDDLFASIGFNMIEDLDLFLHNFERKSNIEVKSMQVEYDEVEKENASLKETRFGNWDNLNDARQNLSRAENKLIAATKIIGIFTQKYPEIVVNEISRK